MVQILELFGGIGSPRCALRNIGIPVKAIDYVEIDEKAVRSYNAMFSEELRYKTQSVVGWNLKPDILIHGSPCQDFSIAGHQGKAKAEGGRINRGKGADEGSGTRSSLMWETIHIIEQMGEWRPRYVIWENVKNVLSRYMRANFDRYIKEMERLGYSSSFKILDAREFGLPQARERVFTVSTLGEKAFSFDCQPADAQREELALKAPAQLGAELEDERIIIDPDEEGTFTLYLQSDAVTSNAITVTVIDSARIEAEKQAEEEARRREEAERQKAQEAEAAAQAEAAQQAQQEQAASQRTPASGGNAQTPVQASVYIAASGNGTKYHSDPHCSRMNGVIEMSVEEAQAMGYTPCKKCY